MAKGNKKNNSRVTAGDLFGKLGRKQEKAAAEEVREDEFLEDSEYAGDENADELYDSIDLTSAADGDSSDSDLDINELLRKYMPEYDSDESSDEDEAFSGGVLSKLKQTAAETVEDAVPEEKNDDEKLIDALDSVFSSAIAQDVVSNAADAVVNGKKPRRYHIVSIDSDGKYSPVIKHGATITEYDTGKGKTKRSKAAEPEKPQKKQGFFASLFGKSDDKSKAEKKGKKSDAAVSGADVGVPIDEETELLLQSMNIGQNAPAQNNAGPEELKLDKADDLLEGILSDDEMAMLDEAVNAPNMELSLAPDENEAAGSEASAQVDLFDELEAAEEDVPEEETEEADDEIDPTDINLMVAFGLDGGEDKKADRAKELGDRLEATQTSKVRKHKLDRPEFVDKTQTPKIRKEYRQREISLWVKLGVCAVFTVLLLIFENISVLTKLFTGSSMQFAGVLDPAVYPTVYIMISLQLMLLACVCAFDEIVAGFKYLFRGTPRPESMTALLTVAGIVYSVVLSHLVKAPSEPVMFNFVVALSALLTLIYAIFNNKREMMNFRVVANKKPKHIVRRLLDEESECESKAFADAEDVCDVMKIEKADFVDGFFGRLSAPDSNTGIFMTFIMGVSAAIAILFGIFANFRGGDASMVCRVIYSAMLIIAPLSVYLTFSYPFYRANLAAKEYDSAIIGETSLEEYSNASIISFDDKNVFPSYSVKVQNIRIYNNARIDRVLYYAASAFAYAGGPLQDVFEVATKDMGVSNNVQIFDTETGFLATQVDGVNIIFGSCDALRSRGLDIPVSAAEDDVDLSDELEIMYMFRESKLVAKMYIQYVMDGDIDLILKQFSGSGLYVCVRTFDPNISERMIAKKLNMKRMPLKIVRYASADEVGTYSEKVDSGLVTCGTPKSLLQVISYCGKVLHTKKTNIALSVLSVMIGVTILALLLLSGSMDTLNSLFIAIYQLIWLIPMIISSKMFIR